MKVQYSLIAEKRTALMGVKLCRETDGQGRLRLPASVCYGSSSSPSSI
jgi:hypothetical protein